MDFLKEEKKSLPLLFPGIILLVLIVLAAVLISVLGNAGGKAAGNGPEAAQGDAQGATGAGAEGAENAAGASGTPRERVKTIVRGEDGQSDVKDMTDDLLAAGYLDAPDDGKADFASDEVTDAASDSGMFQVADLIFSMPVRFGVLTDNGIRIVYVDGKIPKEPADFMLTGNVSHRLLCIYRDICFEAKIIMGPGEQVSDKCPVTSFKLVGVTEDSDDVMMADNAGHLYFPGGYHIGNLIEDIFADYGQYSYKSNQLVKNSAILYTYGQEGFFESDYTNYISFKVKGNEDTVSKIAQEKNVR